MNSQLLTRRVLPMLAVILTVSVAGIFGRALLLGRQAPTQTPTETIRKTRDGFQNSAVLRVSPEFPEETDFVNERVTVEVTVDESGNVISARPILGRSLFRAAAVEAAGRWKFPPTFVQDRPVKVVGTIEFNVPRMEVTPERLDQLQSKAHENRASAEDHYRLARAFHRIGRIEEAVAECQRAIEDRPEFGLAHFELGELLYSLNRYNDARASFANAFRLRPDLLEAQYGMAACSERLGALNEAVGIWKGLIEKSDDLEVRDIAYTNLCSIYQSTGRDEETLQVSQKLVDVETELLTIVSGTPLIPHVYSYTIGQIHEKAGRTSEAIRAYRQTIEIVRRYITLDPNAEEAAFSYFRIAALIESDGRYDEAIQNYQQGIEIKPNLDEARLRLGLLYLKLGDRESARQQYLVLKSANSELARKLEAFFSK